MIRLYSVSGTLLMSFNGTDRNFLEVNRFHITCIAAVRSDTVGHFALVQVEQKVWSFDYFYESMMLIDKHF